MQISDFLFALLGILATMTEKTPTKNTICHTIGWTRKNSMLHVQHAPWYISFTKSAKRRHENSKFKVLTTTRVHNSTAFPWHLHFKTVHVNAVVAYFANCVQRERVGIITQWLADRKLLFWNHVSVDVTVNYMFESFLIPNSFCLFNNKSAHVHVILVMTIVMPTCWAIPV